MHNPKAVCEIYSVAHRNVCRWKWRYTGANGAVVDCPQEYELFFDCVHAARAEGYEPRAMWTGAALLLPAR
jgi:hypothetical protein